MEKFPLLNYILKNAQAFIQLATYIVVQDTFDKPGPYDISESLKKGEKKLKCIG